NTCAKRSPLSEWWCLITPANRRPRMVEMSMVLARLKREPLGTLPLGPDLDQALCQLGLVWRERVLPPLVTARLFLMQILAGNCSIAALRQLAGVGFAPSSYSDARERLPLDRSEEHTSELQSLAYLVCR